MSYILNEGYEGNLWASATSGCNIMINDKWLLDTQMGSGTFILGHDFTREAIKNSIDKGSLYICPNHNTEECGRLLHEATGFEHFIFANSGSEATMKAMRLARAFTGKDKVALFEGCWHGSQDYNLVTYSSGIPKSVKDSVLMLPFTSDAFDIIAKERPAMVMVEPIQSAFPIDRREFLKKLREVTILNNVVLCFDEVISGFRSSLGGASSYFGIKPDLVTYGKIIGGGCPVGIIGGNEVMEVFRRGDIKMGGTFSANPVTTTGCITILKGLMELDPYEKLHENLRILQDVKSDILQVIITAGMGRLVFTTKSCANLRERDTSELPYEKQEVIIKKLRNMGIHIGSNKLILLSNLHTKEKVLRFKECLESM